MATNITCDKCRTVQQVFKNLPSYQSAPGWGKIQLNMTIASDAKADFPGGRVRIDNDICPACILEMNLPIINNAVQTPSFDSMLSDLVYDAIQDHVENQ